MSTAADAGTGTDDATPTYVVPVVAYRVWCLDADGHLWPRTSQASMMRRLGCEPWPTGSSHARCLLPRRERPSHVAPANDCMCGLYGWHSPPMALEARRDARDLVAGAIITWGDIQVHRSGLRAEYARPVALALPATARRRGGRTALDRLQRAAERYQIALVPDEGLTDEAARHGAVLLDGALPPPRLTWSMRRLRGMALQRSRWIGR